MDWGDFQVFYTVARAKSFVAAAKELKVTYSTLSRHMDVFEKHMGATLFIRQHGKLKLTIEGQEVYAAAGKMSNTAQTVARLLKGRNTKLEGELVVTLSQSLLCNLVLPHLTEFQESFPDIRLEFDTSREFRDIMKGEADIAIRMTDNHEYRIPENLLGLRLPDVHVHAYASAKIAARMRKGNRPDRIGWIKWDKRINFEQMRTHFDKEDIPVTMVVDDINAQVNAVKSGVGLAILPCFLGDADKALARIYNCPSLPALNAWVLAHPDMRNVERIRAFMHFAANCFDRNVELIRGLRPQK
jgi:DNA-binding transcriptional LysR family regulator